MLVAPRRPHEHLGFGRFVVRHSKGHEPGKKEDPIRTEPNRRAGLGLRTREVAGIPVSRPREELALLVVCARSGEPGHPRM